MTIQPEESQLNRSDIISKLTMTRERMKSLACAIKKERALERHYLQLLGVKRDKKFEFACKMEEGNYAQYDAGREHLF
jgi:hypothetical protein